MFGQIARGWDILGQSWEVLRQDKRLMLFPVLSSLACLLVVASFVVPFVFAPGMVQNLFADEDQPGGGQAWQQATLYVVAFAFYFANYFVIVFFNTALVSCAVLRFHGDNPTVGDGLRMAGARLPQILGWALVAATVGMLLKALEERLDFLGQLVIRLVGVAWSAVTYFVVPVLAVEKVGPLTAVRRSAALLRKTWGESLAGNLSLGVISFLLALPAIALIVLGGIAGAALNSVALAVGLAALGVLYLIGLSIVTSTLQQIFLAGVYMYAAEGRVPAGFSEASLQSAFRTRG